MKSVLVSIQPQHVENICTVVGEENGKPIYKKTVEVRKTRPQEVPFRAYIYQTKKKWIYKVLEWLGLYQGKVIGQFVCDRIDKISYDDAIKAAAMFEDFTYWDNLELDKTCLHPDDLDEYADGKNVYGWHISDLKVYDKPKKLGEFRNPALAENDCWYKQMGLKKRDCTECKHCIITRPPQSWCYVEESNG